METTTKPNILETITMKIIALLDKVASGDIETWIPRCGLARNPMSRHVYTALNQLLLSYALYEKEYTYNHWLTFKQIREAGGVVNKGERSTMVTFTEVLYFYQDAKITAKEAKEVFMEAKDRDPTISTYKEAGISTKRFIKYYQVFNVVQTSDLPPELTEENISQVNHAPLFSTEQLVKQHHIKVVPVSANDAFYDRVNDRIQMPLIEQFTSVSAYSAVLLHECVHWSGHPSRLNRTFGKAKTEEYAFEELIAELGSAILCAELGIPASLTSAAAYIQSWLKALQNDHNYVLKAMRHVEQAVRYFNISINTQ